MTIKSVLMTMALTAAAAAVQAQSDRVISQKEKDYNVSYHEPDSMKALAVGEKFLKDYPVSKADAKDDRARGIGYHRVYYNMIAARPSLVDANIKRFYDELPFLTVSELYYRKVQMFNLHKLAKPEELVGRSTTLINKLKMFQGHQPADMADLSAQEWEKRFDGVYFPSLLTHFSILKDTKKLKEAEPVAAELLSRYGYGIASFNEDYVNYLSLAGEKEKMMKALQSSVNANQASPAMLEMLKKDYLAKNKDANGFEAYIESLKSQEGKVKLESEMKAQMIRKEIPGFKVYDSNGNLVNSKDWKGKIVVLDFFSSWCVPCKASFPGMKMAMESLANDKDVVFYYMDNQEHSKDYKTTVMKYMKDNNFPFNVLFDNEGDKGVNNEVCKLLGVTAIPRKMIMDKEGYVRFDMDSYYGSPTKLADEIKIMVELVKKGK